MKLDSMLLLLIVSMPAIPLAVNILKFSTGHMVSQFTHFSRQYVAGPFSHLLLELLWRTRTPLVFLFSPYPTAHLPPTRKVKSWTADYSSSREGDFSIKLWEWLSYLNSACLTNSGFSPLLLTSICAFVHCLPISAAFY